MFEHKNIGVGQIPKSQSIQFQSLIKSPFPNVDLVWTRRVRHGGTNKVSIEICVHSTCTCVCEFLEGKQGDVKTNWNGTHTKTCLYKRI
jgi:hypothetical protein